MDRKLRTRVLEVLRHGSRGESEDPLVREGYTQSEVEQTVHELKKAGVILEKHSFQWWREDRLTGPGSHVIDEIQAKRDDQIYWNMLMEDHRREFEAGR